MGTSQSAVAVRNAKNDEYLGEIKLVIGLGDSIPLHTRALRITRNCGDVTENACTSTQSVFYICGVYSFRRKPPRKVVN